MFVKLATQSGDIYEKNNAYPTFSIHSCQLSRILLVNCRNSLLSDDLGYSLKMKVDNDVISFVKTIIPVFVVYTCICRKSGVVYERSKVFFILYQSTVSVPNWHTVAIVKYILLYYLKKNYPRPTDPPFFF